MAGTILRRDLGRFIYVVALAGVLAMSTAALAQDQAGLDAARTAMQAQQFDQAVQLVDAYLKGKPKDADEAHYLRALALHYGGKQAEAVAEADATAAQFPNSPWRYKVLFLKAQALVAQRKFEPAEAIYRAQAEQLLSDQRKHEIAGVLIQFADALSTEPDPNDLKAPRPDYAKAYKLYAKALEMEISRSLREDVMFKRALTIQKANNHGQAINDFHAYLNEFDPDWTGPVGSAQRARQANVQNAPPAGAHRFEARYRLAESQIMANQFVPARQNLEDLLTLLARQLPQGDQAAAQTKLRGDATWQIVRTYRMPANVNGDELERAIKSARDFLAEYTDHPHAVEAAFLIAQTYQVHGRLDQAIAAYEDFIAAKIYKLPAGDAATTAIKPLDRSPAELQDQWQKLAVYTIGQLRLAQKKYAAAIAQWQQYINRYPDGPQWATSQRQIIDAEYMIALDEVAQKKYDGAAVLLEKFLAAHPLDGRAAQAMFIVGQMKYAVAEEQFKAAGGKPLGQAARNGEPAAAAAARKAYLEAINQWEKLVSKYPNTDPSSLALYRVGLIFEERLGVLDKALEAYRRLSWGPYAGNARSRVAIMTQKQLALRTERTFRTNEPASVVVNVRNIEKLTVKQYFLDLEAYFRKTHYTGGIESLDIALIAPDKTWETPVEGYARYQPFEQSIAIPFDAKKPGVCIVHVSDEKDLEATTLVIRSDLDMIVKSSRRQVLVFTIDALAGKPAVGVDLLISDGSKVIGTGKTGADGVWRQAFDELKDMSSVRVFAKRGGSVASDLVNVSRLKLSAGLSPKGYIYTARSAYQPGQQVALRGIIRDVVDGSYKAPAGASYLLSVTDPAGRLLRQEQVNLSAFGTFNTTLPLEDAAPLGQYTVTVQPKDKPDDARLTFNGSFVVNQFQLQKIRLDLDFQRQVYFRGEVVNATVKADYYWGEPVADKPVRYTLPDGRSYVVRTDAEGQVKFDFDTTGMTPGRPLVFTATLEGENIGVRSAAFLAKLGFAIKVEPSADLVLAGEPFDVTITTTSADDKPTGRDLTLLVLRRELPKTDPVLGAVPWVGRREQPAGEVTVQEKKVTTDPVTGKATVRLTLDAGGQYILRAAGDDRFKQTVTAQAMVTLSDDTDETKLRLFAESDTLQVGAKATVRLHSRIDNGLALVTFEGERVIEHRVVAIKKGFNDVAIAVGHAFFPNFRVSVAAIDGRELRTAEKDFTVQRQLRVAVEPVKPTDTPGAAARVALAVTDQLGNPVAGELSLALVEEALYALYPDAAPPIVAFFQEGARRDTRFSVASSADFAYHGATRAVNQAIVQENERLVENEDRAENLSRLDDISRLADRRSAAMTRGGDLERVLRPMSEPQVAVAAQEKAKQLGLAEDFNAPAAPAPAGAVAANGQAADFYLGARLQATSGVAGRRQYSLASKREAGDKQVDWGMFVGGGKGGGDGLTAARQELPDDGWWLPAVVTDAQGKATVEMALPQKTTQWRLTARGVSAEPGTLVGEATAKLVTRKDFFLSIKTPRSLQEGDHVRVLTRVHNLTDFAGPVDLKLSVTSNGKRYYELVKRVTVEKGKGAEVLFDDMEVPQAQRLKIEVAGVAGNNVDAVAQVVDVRPWGLEYADHGGGVATGDASVSLQLPGAVKYRSVWMTLSVGPSVQRSVIDLAMGWTFAPPVPIETQDRLGPITVLPRPVGGFAGSELLAAVSGLEYARLVNSQPKDVDQLIARVRSLVSALVVTQNKDGGWGWRNDPGRNNSDWAVSSTSYWALARANQQGVKVNADTLNKSQTYLKNKFQQVSATDDDAKAVILHALSAGDAADFANLNRLHRQRNNLSATALAYTAAAFANLKRNELAGELLAVLATKAVDDNADGRVLTHFVGTNKHAWLNEPIETTAMALLAMVKVQPASPRAAQMAQYLLNARGCFGFTPAKARGPAVAALAAWFANGKFAQAQFDLTVLVNGQPVHTIARRGAEGTVLLSVPTELIVDGKNMVSFKMNGRGEYAYAATLRGFSDQIKDPESWTYPVVRSRRYYHAPLEYRGLPINASSTSPVKNLEVGQRTRVYVDLYTQVAQTRYLLIEEPLPAGATLVAGSVSGNYRHVDVTDGKITIYLPPGTNVNDFSYELVGYSTGNYRVLPTVIRDALDPGRMRLGHVDELRVLDPGAKSPDPYVTNNGERYAMGKSYFDDGLYRDALPFLSDLFTSQRTYQERDTARMLLWIYTSPGFYDARRIVDMFEVLRERYPELYIPFDKILTVGRAYHDIGEFERAWLVFRATVDASFINDSNVSAVLQDEGQLLGSIDYQEDLWYRYPDTAEVASAFFALSQLLYQQAPNAAALAKTQRHIIVPGQAPPAPAPAPAPGNAAGDAQPKPQAPPTREDMLAQTIRMLDTFLTLYPRSPLADDAAFSMANAYLDLKQYDAVVKLSAAFKDRYAKSEFATGFQYMEALGYFWKRDYDPALTAARVVADGETKDRDFARYILGQIYHAQGSPADAIKWYHTVEEQYPDARQSIGYFEEKRISLDEVNIFQPAKPVELKLKYRNIKEAALQVYKVDLMKLYLREKNLSNITAVNLAGIEPQLVMALPLGDGKDYVDKVKTAKLDLKDEGAYLVICRGDDLFTSGLVLITPLTIEVQEDATSGTVRANVIDQVKNLRPAEVHVKAIGTADSQFTSGQTDLRGLFVADGLHGKATVIARDDESRYAFYRGDTWLGQAPQPAQQQQERQLREQLKQLPNAQKPDYQDNLRKSNSMIQNRYLKGFDTFRRDNNKGVQIEQAK